MTSLRVRAREVGLISGELPAGPHNAITDVGGVLVGHATLISGEGKLQPGLGPGAASGRGVEADPALIRLDRALPPRSPRSETECARP
jgi:D-aminopeptidase